ncbi:MAG: HAD-IA family hydrolase [Deltaproteobacteria bacterium]|nr:HAD-IA family hydrolase [Deltaproteobacteria bacterium]
MRRPAIIFDLDGTLLDSLDDIATAANRALAQRGHPTHTTAAIRGFIGDGIENLVRRALPNTHRQPDEIEATVAAMIAAYATSDFARTQPYPGINQLIAELTRRQLPLAVLSNKNDDFVVQLTQLRFADHFTIARGARPGVPKKPHPQAALELAQQLGVPAQACVFVGDTAVDIETAHAAKMYPVGVSWGFRPRAELQAARASVIIDQPGELLGLLSKL